ncbi:MAG: hypothetical protein Q4D38_05170 [Planctomycetia bacterium]|nr:hypothetical protein [Planctomycetia bacterium]
MKKKDSVLVGQSVVSRVLHQAKRKGKEYIAKIYKARSAKNDSFYYALGEFRGFFHALGACGAISPVCEFWICSLDPFACSRSEFLQKFLHFLVLGFESVAKREFSATDELIFSLVRLCDEF